jgi:endonuclease/exonuclease/phosphatase family metal-dependent hydrolase
VTFTVGTWNLENLFRPGNTAGPPDDATYQAKLAGLAARIDELAPDVLGVEEIGEPEALADLVALLSGDWHVALSAHFNADHPIRVGVISRLPLDVVADVATFPPALAPIHAADIKDRLTTAMGRGALAVRVEPAPGHPVTIVVCHLKSKLLEYPAAPGHTRFNPHDEGERARVGAYALFRRAAEAVTVRALADELVAGDGRQHAVIVLGDLNDEPLAATTQILLGPPGSELLTRGADIPDKGDAWRLWNLAHLLPDTERVSRVHNGRGELIDHILVSHALKSRVKEAHIPIDHPLPSVDDNPNLRRSARTSDHAPVIATFAV